jgi:hypothetical protein
MHYSTNANEFENDIPSDALDALADLVYEQRQAMMESDFTDYYKLHHEINEHEDPDDVNYWSAAKAAQYSSNDDTAMAAFNYSSDSCETDRWR